MAGGGEYEPKDSRNVTGTASTPDGRWTRKAAKPPKADGGDEESMDDRDGTVEFEPDPALLSRIEKGEAERRIGKRQTRH